GSEPRNAGRRRETSSHGRPLLGRQTGHRLRRVIPGRTGHGGHLTPERLDFGKSLLVGTLELAQHEGGKTEAPGQLALDVAHGFAEPVSRALDVRQRPLFALAHAEHVVLCAGDHASVAHPDASRATCPYAVEAAPDR